MSPTPTKILRERDIEGYLKKKVKAARGEVRKVRWIGRSGAPDRLVMVHGMSVWVELKGPRKVATNAQWREHTRMRKAGLFVVVISDYAGVDELIKVLAPRRYKGLETVIGTPAQIGDRVLEIDRRDAGIAYDKMLSTVSEYSGTPTMTFFGSHQISTDENTVDVTPGKLVDKTV